MLASFHQQRQKEVRRVGQIRDAHYVDLLGDVETGQVGDYSLHLPDPVFQVAPARGKQIPVITKNIAYLISL